MPKLDDANTKCQGSRGSTQDGDSPIPVGLGPGWFRQAGDTERREKEI